MLVLYVDFFRFKIQIKLINIFDNNNWCWLMVNAESRVRSKGTEAESRTDGARISEDNIKC